MPAFVPLLIGGVIVLAGTGAWAASQAAKKRREAMRLAAQMMGFTFTENGEPEKLADFPLHRHGGSRKFLNVLAGELAGRAAVIGDYSYYVSSGKSGHRVSQTAVLFPVSTPGLPDFDLSPENVLHRLAGVFGYQDIDFDSNEEFSKSYLLRGPDEAAIRRAFTPNALMQLASQPGWNVEAVGGRLLVFKAAKSADAAQLPAFAAEALRIAGALSPRVPS